ncbi:hypothetical protein [Streptomyces sp. NPDC004285]
MVEVIIAAVAGVIGAALGSWATMRSARTTQRAALETARSAERSALQTAWIAKEVKEAQIEIVDASFVDAEILGEGERAGLAIDESRPGSQVIMDVKLRNAGGETAYIYEIVLRVLEVRHGFRIVLPENMRSSGFDSVQGSTYYYNGPSRKGKKGEQFQSVSQVLLPGEADRFLVSFDSPAAFFRADLQVLFNAGRAVEAADVKYLGKPLWSESDEVLGHLRQFLQRCGRTVEWRGEEMPAAEAGRRCLAEYEKDLLGVAGLYELVGRTVDPQYDAICAARSRIPHMRRELGLDEQTQ